MAKTTMHRAAKVLGVPWHSLGYHVKRGHVSHERVGGIYLVDPDVAREELEQAGYYQRRAAFWGKIGLEAARRQAG